MPEQPVFILKQIGKTFQIGPTMRGKTGRGLFNRVTVHDPFEKCLPAFPLTHDGMKALHAALTQELARRAGAFREANRG